MEEILTDAPLVEEADDGDPEMHTLLFISGVFILAGIVITLITTLLTRHKDKHKAFMPPSPPPLTRLGDAPEASGPVPLQSPFTVTKEVVAKRVHRLGGAEGLARGGLNLTRAIYTPVNKHMQTPASPSYASLNTAWASCGGAAACTPENRHLFSTPFSEANRVLGRALFSLPTPAPPTPAPQGHQQGWDPAMLQACAANEAHMTSVEGLMHSKAFQAHIRSKHSHLDLAVDQAEARMDTYRHLRAFDREGFLHAFSRKDLQDFDAVAPHRLLLVADQLVQSAMNIGLVLLCARAALIGSDTQGLMPLLAGVSWWLMLGWVLVNVVLAWRFSHPSILGEVLNMYCVRPCPQYPEHTQPAGLLRTAGAALLEGVLAACTLGTSAVVSGVMVAVTHDRASLGQRLCGIYVVREVVCTVHVPQFSSPAATSPPRGGPRPPQTPGSSCKLDGRDNTPASTGPRRQLPPDGTVVFGMRQTPLHSLLAATPTMSGLAKRRGVV